MTWRWPWRKRRVARLHLLDGAPSLEGVYMGRVGRKHYRLEAASVVQTTEDSVPLEGFVLVPVERVAFIQVID